MTASRLQYLGLSAAVLALMFPVFLPTHAYAATTTISQDTAFADTTIAGGDTVVIEQGATLSMGSVINKGTIINHGKIALGPFGSLTNDGGSIDNAGVMDFSLADLVSKNGGTIKNENGASVTFRQAGSPVSHVFENGAGSTVRNAGAITLDDVFGFVNEGTFINECGGSLLLTGPSTGNALVDGCSSPRETATLQVRSIDLAGNSISGMWTTIRSIPDGAVLKTGFTPFTFTGVAGLSYAITVSNYGGRTFSNWENGMGGNSRTIGLPANTVLTAAYDVGDSVRGFTALTFAGTAEQPDLTVNAVSLDGTRTLHMWTIIDPQTTDVSGTTYKVYAGNYQNIVFDHWNDGNADRIRTLTIDKATTITAFYRTEPSQNVKVEFAYKDCGLSAAGCGVGTTTCSDGTTEGPGPISLAFGFTVSKSSGNPVEGIWRAAIPGAAGPSGASGSLNTLSFDGANFITTGDLSSGAICTGDPTDNVNVTFSGQCGGTEVKFEATNGTKATIQGDVTCKSV